MAMRHIDPVRIPLSEREILGAIDQTTAAAAIFAKRNHPTWKNRTGALEGSIRMDPARRVSATRFRGSFGSFDVNYAIYLELGTRSIRAGHFIRNAADAEFPRLASRLRGAAI